MTTAPPTPPRAPDWGLGRYELTAAQLLPAAEALVARAAIAPGERVVDVGCGTGNAALLAAARGARVTGVDPAARLLDVARREAAARGLDATFVPGEAARIPLEDGAADVVLSSFGVIFAPDPVPAAAEMARVTAPRGRIVLSAWIPEGAIFEMVRTLRQAVDAALGQAAPRARTPPGSSSGPPAVPSHSPPFGWHDRQALERLFAPHGFRTEVVEERQAFMAASPTEYLNRQFDNHPLSIATLAVVAPLGKVAELRARALAVLEAGNEDPSAFRVTSRYNIATARR